MTDTNPRPTTVLGSHGMVALLIAGLGAGCVHYYEPVPVSPPVPLRQISAPGRPGDPAVMAEIDAATQLSFESKRHRVLRAIAVRPDLSAAVQVHLVNSIYRGLAYDANRRDLLLTLIENPAFSAPAKEAILLQLNLLVFERNRQRILNALDARGPLPTR